LKQWVITKEFPNETRSTVIELWPAQMTEIQGIRRWHDEYLMMNMVLIARHNKELHVEIFPLYCGPKKDAREYWHLLTECGFENESD
jgi:hypothetical protein